MLDAVICGFFRIWSHLGFHVFALFFLWRGFSALRQLTPAPRRISTRAAQPNRLMR
jgi:hypothetical protein